MGRRLWLYGPALLCAAAIFGLSHQATLPQTPTGDKFAHIVAYTVLGALFARPLWFDTSWPSGMVAIAAAWAATLYGISDEWHQSFVVGRHASVEDVAADALGAVLGGFGWGFGCRVLARFTTRVQRVTATECAIDASSSSPSSPS